MGVAGWGEVISLSGFPMNIKRPWLISSEFLVPTMDSKGSSMRAVRMRRNINCLRPLCGGLSCCGAFNILNIIRGVGYTSDSYASTHWHWFYRNLKLPNNSLRKYTLQISKPSLLAHRKDILASPNFLVEVTHLLLISLAPTEEHLRSCSKLFFILTLTNTLPPTSTLRFFLSFHLPRIYSASDALQLLLHHSVLSIEEGIIYFRIISLTPIIQKFTPAEEFLAELLQLLLFLVLL